MNNGFLSLFSGIGLHDLGLERAGWKCMGQCEIEDFCNQVLEKHWPGLPRWRDVSDVGRSAVEERCHSLPVLITGGFPCQQISCAGKGEGIGTKESPTDVSGLWWQMRRVIEEIRPSWVLAENVPALRTRGSDAVISSLEELGYTVWPLVVGAWSVGAPHKRDRVWIVAHHVRQRECGQDGEGGGILRVGDGGQVSGKNVWRPSPPEEELAHGQGGGLGADWGASRDSRYSHQRSETLHGARWPVGPEGQQFEWENPRLLEPGVGRPVDGDARRLARLRTSRLKSIGNANPPQVAEALGRAILHARTLHERE